MFPARGSYGGSRGASFAQILMKNAPPTSGLSDSDAHPLSHAPDSHTHPPDSHTHPPALNHRPSEDHFHQKGKSTFKRGYSFKPSVSPQSLIDKYTEGETNAVSLLHQLASVLQFHLEMKETVTTGNIPGLYFAFCVVIDGVEYKTGMGITKKAARLKAAQLALPDLLPTLQSLKSFLPEASDVPPPLPVKEEPSISDMHPCRAIRERTSSVNLQILHAVRDQLTKLMNSHPEFSPCAGTTAAFIIQTSSGYEVVALGTGSWNTKEGASSSGRIVHDSHALVNARRSLMRFLYRHLLMFFNKTAKLTEKSVFQQSSSSSGLLSLKSDITLHLYVNQLPKGASQIQTKLRLNPRSILAWQVNNEISLHLSVEGKVFSVFSSAFDHSASTVVSMSATDKLTQWQVLGYQGALLSHFIEPIYVQNILIGDVGCSDIHGMKTSVSQRVEGITPQLPMFYCMVRPHISLVPAVATNTTDGCHYGINWSEGDSFLEVVDGLEGKTIEESPFKSGPALASRLCKAAMLHRFKLVAKDAQRQDLLATSSYGEAKRMAQPYQEAKKVLRAYLLQQGFGPWLVKLSASDNFNM
ncbi:hypothetical protein VZT92_023745 [Zoarces viviparus]|uniref:Adenosine deaminase domain-containing protein 1 n=1 Tax=Zoarces viviparus TaxID=48416 RepID=A0AAW1E9K5_ZOAVI